MSDPPPPPKPTPTLPVGQTEEEESTADGVCIVCMERCADTLALPCGHQVCCRRCSDALRTTPNARLCVLCRQPLTGVAQDEA